MIQNAPMIVVEPPAIAENCGTALLGAKPFLSSDRRDSNADRERPDQNKGCVSRYQSSLSPFKEIVYIQPLRSN